MGAMSTTVALGIGSITTFVRVFPHNFFSFGQMKHGCRVSLEDAATVSRCGSFRFLFTPLSTTCGIRSRNSRFGSSTCCIPLPSTNL